MSPDLSFALGCLVGGVVGVIAGVWGTLGIKVRASLKSQSGGDPE